MPDEIADSMIERAAEAEYDHDIRPGWYPRWNAVELHVRAAYVERVRVALVAALAGGEWRVSRGHKHPGNDVTIWWGEDCGGPYAGEFVSDVWYGPPRPYVEVATDG